MPSIEIRGIDKLQRKLRSVEAVNEKLRRPMQRSVLRLQRDMADYPPAPPRSSYRRTGTLGRAWTTDVQAGPTGLQGTVGNAIPYGPFVQSAQFQARWHRGRWQTDEDVVRENEGEIIKDFNKSIQDALDS